MKRPPAKGRFGTRYRIVECLYDGHPALYRVADREAPGMLLRVRETPSRDAAAAQRALEAMSWLRHPCIALPLEVVTHRRQVFVVEAPVRGLSLDACVAAASTTAYALLQWAIQACDLVAALHQYQPHPLTLGRLSPASLVLSPEGHLHLVGFGFDRPGRLIFEAPEAELCWEAPEGFTGERADVWCLGRLLQWLLREAPPEVRSTLRRTTRIEEVIARALAAGPELLTVSRFKAELVHLTRAHLGGPHWPNLPGTLAERPAVPPMGHRLAAAVLVMACLAGWSWGLQDMREAWRELGAGLPRSSPSRLAALPAGSDVWVEGQVAPQEGPLLVSPISQASCVGYHARVSREQSRQTWDRRELSYRNRLQEELLFEQIRWTPFVLRDAAAATPVVADLALPGGHPVERTWQPDTLPQDVAEMAHAWVVKAGEQVRAVHARETFVKPGETVCIRGRLRRERGVVSLEAPNTGQVSVFLGNGVAWWSELTRRLLPGLATCLGAAGLVFFGGRRLRPEFSNRVGSAELLGGEVRLV